MKKMIQMMLVAGAMMAFATAAKAQCNLRIAGMRAEISRGGTNVYTCIRVLVHNSGSVASSNRVMVAVYVDPKIYPSCDSRHYLMRTSTDSIPARTSRWCVYFPARLPRGIHLLWAHADSWCTVPETNENDNLGSMSVMVP